MKTSIRLLGLAVVLLVVGSGVVAAVGGGAGAIAADGNQTSAGPGPGSGVGPATDADRPYDGHNSPWVSGDERLDRFQERFGLTDAQMEQLRVEVTELIQSGADRDAVREHVRATLVTYGVDDPVLGPVDGAQRIGGQRGPGPNGPADGPVDGTDHPDGFGWGLGPNGPGSCLG